MTARPLRLSVITAVRNAAGTIADTIDSVLAQTHPAIQHVVVDGASTDGTLDVIRSYGDRVSEWTSERDAGISEAFNKGLRRATGDYVVFLSADDAFASPTVVAEMLSAAERLGVPDVLYGDCLMVDHETGDVLWRVPHDPQAVSVEKGRAQPHPSTLMHRRYFERFGEFDTSYRVAMDLELFLRGIPTVGMHHVPLLVTRVRTGGMSMVHATQGYAEAIRALDVHGRFRTPLGPWLMRGRFAARRFGRAAVVGLGLYKAVAALRRARRAAIGVGVSGS